jgi:hypothetical protein
MRVAVVVVSSDQTVLDFVRAQKGRLLPNSLRNLNYTFDFMIFNPLKGVEIRDFVLNKIFDFECFGLLLDSNSPLDVGRDCASFFLVRAEFPENREKLNNFFGNFLAIWLGNLIFLREKFSSRGNAKFLLLPRRNFCAIEIDKIFKLIEFCLLKPNFREQLEEAIRNLRKRSSPKKASRSPNRYIVDDDEKFFEFATEKHAEAATGGPHDSTCKLNKRFRFGVSVNSKDHFNVSKGRPGKTWSGNIVDCHSTPKSFSNVSHLNVFPNDYVEM